METDVVGNTCDPVFDHTQMFSLPCITEDHLLYFEAGGVTFSAYAKQSDTSPLRYQDLTTRDLMLIERQKQDASQSSNVNSVTTRRRDPMTSQISIAANNVDANNNNTMSAVTNSNEVARLKTEFIMLQKKMERYEKREARLAVRFALNFFWPELFDCVFTFETDSMIASTCLVQVQVFADLCDREAAAVAIFLVLT